MSEKIICDFCLNEGDASDFASLETDECGDMPNPNICKGCYAKLIAGTLD